MNKRELKTALISTFDKTGVTELALALNQKGVEIISTGGTAGVISAAGVPVTLVEDLTGFPECLDGRVKTLHPKIYAGILADMDNSQHAMQLFNLDCRPFDLVVVDFYPFRKTVQSGANEAEIIEKIDIGGPAMARAAAKNFANVAVVVKKDRYEYVIDAIEYGGFTLEERKKLAIEAFIAIAQDDIDVAMWLE